MTSVPHQLFLYFLWAAAGVAVFAAICAVALGVTWVLVRYYPRASERITQWMRRR